MKLGVIKHGIMQGKWNKVYLSMVLGNKADSLSSWAAFFSHWDETALWNLGDNHNNYWEGFISLFPGFATGLGKMDQIEIDISLVY